MFCIATVAGATTPSEATTGDNNVVSHYNSAAGDGVFVLNLNIARTLNYMTVTAGEYGFEPNA